MIYYPCVWCWSGWVSRRKLYEEVRHLKVADFAYHEQRFGFIGLTFHSTFVLGFAWFRRESERKKNGIEK